MHEETADRSEVNTRGVSPTEAIVACVVLAMVLGYLLWSVASRMRGPIIYEDEHGPLELARTLIGQQEVAETKYYPGYAFTLIPGTLAASSAYGEYRAALIANVLLIVGSAVLLCVALLRLYPSAPWRVALPVGVAFTLPYVSSSAGLVWSESASIAMVTVVAALVVWYMRCSRTSIALLAAALAGLSLAFHPRLVAMVPGLLVALASASAVSERRRTVTLAGLVGGGALAAAFILRRSVVDLVSSSSNYTTPEPDLDRGWHFVTDFIGILVGRLSTDSLAAAFLPVAILVLPEARQRLKELSPVVVFAAGFTLITLFYTAANVAMSGITRPDFVYYTRYQGPGIVLLAALAGVAIAQSSSWGRWGRSGPILATAGGLFAAWLIVRSLVESQIFGSSLVEANVPELAFLDGDLHPDRVFLLVAFVAILILGVTFLPIDRIAVVVLAGIVAVVLSQHWYDEYAVPGSIGRSAERALVPYLENLRGDECVLFDQQSVSFWNRANYEFFSSARFLPFEDHEEECGPLLIVGASSSVRLPGQAVPIAEEPMAGLTLYDLKQGR